MECNIMYYYVWNTVEKVRKKPVLLSSNIDHYESTDYIWDIVPHQFWENEMKAVTDFC